MTTKVWIVHRERVDEIKKKTIKQSKLIKITIHPTTSIFMRLTRIKAARSSITSFHHFNSMDVRLCRPSGHFQLSVQIKNKYVYFEFMVKK